MTLSKHLKPDPDEELRVIVCGSRSYTNRSYVCGWLERLFCPIYMEDTEGKMGTWLPRPDLRMILGGAKGVDSFALDWCLANWVQYKIEEADWTQYGDAAGPIRNRKMIEMKPHLVVAFSGGKGTRNMCQLAKDYDVALLRIP